MSDIGMFGKECSECPVMFEHGRCRNFDCKLCVATEGQVIIEQKDRITALEQELAEARAKPEIEVPQSVKELLTDTKYTHEVMAEWITLTQEKNETLKAENAKLRQALEEIKPAFKMIMAWDSTEPTIILCEAALDKIKTALAHTECTEGCGEFAVDQTNPDSKLDGTEGGGK